VLPSETMTWYEKRQQIVSYVAPRVTLFSTKFALVFGTRHGVPNFANEILSLYGQAYLAESQWLARTGMFFGDIRLLLSNSACEGVEPRCPVAKVISSRL
jgi:hypothetical protein